MYFKENPLPNKFRNAMPALWTWAHHRFYWDELYQLYVWYYLVGVLLLGGITALCLI